MKNDLRQRSARSVAVLIECVLESVVERADAVLVRKILHPAASNTGTGLEHWPQPPQTKQRNYLMGSLRSEVRNLLRHCRRFSALAVESRRAHEMLCGVVSVEPACFGSSGPGLTGAF